MGGCGGVGGVVVWRVWWCMGVVVWGVWGCGAVGGVVVWWVLGVWVCGCVGVGGVLPLRSNIPRSALCVTLDTYNL
jgi:hypothetical protein